MLSEQKKAKQITINQYWMSHLNTMHTFALATVSILSRLEHCPNTTTSEKLRLACLLADFFSLDLKVISNNVCTTEYWEKAEKQVRCSEAVRTDIVKTAYNTEIYMKFVYCQSSLQRDSEKKPLDPHYGVKMITIIENNL